VKARTRMSATSQARPSSRSILLDSSLLDTDGDGTHTLRATDTLPTDATVVTLPFAQAITPALAKRALAAACSEPSALTTLSERQLVCTYICAHWALGLASFSGQGYEPVSSVYTLLISAHTLTSSQCHPRPQSSAIVLSRRIY
jgi:hypothetical protein